MSKPKQPDEIYRGYYIEELDKADENGFWYIIRNHAQKEAGRTKTHEQAYSWVDDQLRVKRA